MDPEPDSAENRRWIRFALVMIMVMMGLSLVVVYLDWSQDAVQEEESDGRACGADVLHNPSVLDHESRDDRCNRTLAVSARTVLSSSMVDIESKRATRRSRARPR